jgi:hypothetical protein
MQTSITFACGHAEKVTMYGGKYSEQEKRLARRECSTCEAKSQTKALQALKDKYLKNITLPELTGTPKQIAWANELRIGHLAHCFDYFERQFATVGEHNTFAGRQKMLVEWLAANKTEAKWWIETGRNMDAPELLKLAAENCAKWVTLQNGNRIAILNDGTIIGGQCPKSWQGKNLKDKPWEK